MGQAVEVATVWLLAAVLFLSGLGVVACTKDPSRMPQVAPYIQPFAPGSGYITLTGLTERR